MKEKGKYYLGRSILLLVLFVLHLSVSGQVIINEFSAANSTLVSDPDYNDFADWIELYNSAGTDLNLKGYFLSDELDVPGKWKIEKDTIIPAGGFILIWADGKNEGLHANFRLSAAGEEIGLYDSMLGLLDSLTYPLQKTDVSMGRVPDGGANWGYFLNSSPAAGNPDFAYPGFTSLLPDFSHKGGFYISPLSVELSSLQGGLIRYTRDGSIPDENAEVYASPISIESTTILRVRIFEDGKIPGPTLTQSYFINENSVEGILPVVSLATDPDNFWDPDQGIYVQGFKPSWEIPVNVELFENDGGDRAAFNQRAGMKVNGLYSWKLPQKMLGVYFKKQYGEGKLDYPLLRQRERKSYKNFALRASGSDWSYTLFRDILGQSATQPNMDLEIMAFRPAVVFVNGKYLGIHNIREKVDDDYIEKSYNMEPGSFDLVENEKYAEAGDLEAYRRMESFLNEDLSLDANYQNLSQLVDIENFTDYLIAEMATGNTSIDHNVMAWKPKDSGKWRWVLMDLDRGFFEPNENFIKFYSRKDELLLAELWENKTYRQYFAGRLSSQLFTSYHPERMRGLIEEHKNSIEAEIPRHISRWEGSTSDYGDAMPSVEYWENEVSMLNAYVEARPFELLSDDSISKIGAMANLVLATIPEKAASLKLDGLEVPGSFVCGPYIKEIPVELKAESRPGFDFVGWASPEKKAIVARGAVWKYLDSGIYPGADWILAEFDDQAWSEGQAQLGYGEGDEQTTLDDGGDPENRIITTYFRKNFTISPEDQLSDLMVLELLKDDGVVIYLNGTELVRSNMPYGEISHTSTALETVFGFGESYFHVFPVQKDLLLPGENTLAIELHQKDISSTDLSFDLGLSAYIAEEHSIISENNSYVLKMEDDFALIALYEESGACILPDLVDEEMTLSQDCSPYLAQGNVTITANGILNIEPGVEILMPEGASVFVNGRMNARGTSDRPIVFRINPDYQEGQWGILSFRSTPEKSVLNWVTIADASVGPDPISERAAISAFHADLDLDHINIQEVYGDPITARYSEITLTNSYLHSMVTGDLINVKYGGARIENCRFVGNDQPDTDAIDYDEVFGGIIRNVVITDFKGLNSDAIDIGEQATDVSIDSIVVYNVTDKGVSVGQQSTVSILNSVFINCNMGVGVKDSGRVTVDRSIFYNNVNAVVAFEKNPGQSGGNVKISNSILSNSSNAPYYADSKSSLEISHSLSDNTLLPLQASNLNGNPLFAAPSMFNFELLAGSRAKQSGFLDDTPVDMGTRLIINGLEPSVMISQFYIDGDNLGNPEFIKLYNPSSRAVDVSAYQVDKGITITLPMKTKLNKGASLFLTSDANADLWDSVSSRVFQWEEGKLSNNGEAIQLLDSKGIVLDHLVYDINNLWPESGFFEDGVFNLIGPEMDNHLPENWEVESLSQLVSRPKENRTETLSIFPNPTRDEIHISAPDRQNQLVKIYELNGRLLGESMLDHMGEASINLSRYQEGFLLIKIGSQVRKVVVHKD